MIVPSPRLLVTGGSDNLVRVWTLTQLNARAAVGQGGSRLTLKKTLYGHSGMWLLFHNVFFVLFIEVFLLFLFMPRYFVFLYFVLCAV